MPKKIIICGASGMIGKALIGIIQDQNEILVVGRNKEKLIKLFPNVKDHLEWSELTTNCIQGYDYIINLTGENIGKKRWSKNQKMKIMQSRALSTKRITNLCLALKKDSPAIVNASAIGYYGSPKSTLLQNETTYDESSYAPDRPNSFLCEVAQIWESYLKPAEQAGIRVIKLRFSVVLSESGGALKKMLPSFKLGLGSILGTGDQPFSWVTLSDTVKAIQFILQQEKISGPFNIVADEVVSQKDFANHLAKKLNRPRILRLPKALITLMFGEMGTELLLKGQKVEGNRLKALGFQYNYPDIQSALDHLL